MGIRQDLKNYADGYKHFGMWKVLETEHYVFRYMKSSVAEREMGHISETQEQSYAKITKMLGLEDMPQKIGYYIYQSEADKKRLMGDDGFAQAIWCDYSIHMVYTEDIKPIGEHEDTHLLTLPWGVAIGFFQEGLAEYMSGCVWGKDKKPSESFVRNGLATKKISDLKNFFSHAFWMGNADQNAIYYYPLAGTFTRFLIGEFGLEKYREFYIKIRRENPQEENIRIFEDTFGNVNEIVGNYFETIRVT